LAFCIRRQTILIVLISITLLLNNLRADHLDYHASETWCEYEIV
jgi:hypothetical protein